jgi:hypothetical protein
MNEPEVTWRPMSEAPCDGTFIVARWGDAGPLDEPDIVYWSVDGWYLVNMDGPLTGLDVWRELRDEDLPTPVHEPVGDDWAPEELITISLPGIADQIMKDGSYPQDEPERWQRYRATRTVRNIGPTGTASIAALSLRDWSDVLDYLGGYLECVEGMTSRERGEGGKSELRALRLAVKRISDAIGESSG